MKTYNWNGEYWYCNRSSLWSRLRHWFIWIGGWECWDRERSRYRWRLRITYLGKRRWISPTPVSLFGHRITFYGWGMSAWYLTWDWRVSKQAYLSPDGTPNRAYLWLLGTPSEIIEAAASRSTPRAPTGGQEP